jgi:hypothetical protein
MASRPTRQSQPVAPIIVVGMHRSGTTLAVEMLNGLGVYAGRNGGSNREARVFKHFNKWLFTQVGATWDRPDNAAFASAPELQPHLERVVEGQMGAIGALRFLGPMQGLRYRDLRRIDFPWAWKDPRNCFTVGLWKRFFPDAKMLHIYRHPLDVASSLKKREERRVGSFELTLGTKFSELTLQRKQLYGHSYRLLDPLEGVGLWEQYVGAAFEGCAPFERDTIHCRYETLLEKPEETLGEIAAFLGLEPAPGAIERISQDVNPARAFAHRADPALSALAKEVSHLPLVRKLDYESHEADER